MSIATAQFSNLKYLVNEIMILQNLLFVSAEKLWFLIFIRIKIIIVIIVFKLIKITRLMTTFPPGLSWVRLVHPPGASQFIVGIIATCPYKAFGEFFTILLCVYRPMASRIVVRPADRIPVRLTLSYATSISPFYRNRVNRLPQ